jgi:hypothetical protein
MALFWVQMRADTGGPHRRQKWIRNQSPKRTPHKPKTQFQNSTEFFLEIMLFWAQMTTNTGAYMLSGARGLCALTGPGPMCTHGPGAYVHSRAREIMCTYGPGRLCAHTGPGGFCAHTGPGRFCAHTGPKPQSKFGHNSLLKFSQPADSQINRRASQPASQQLARQQPASQPASRFTDSRAS